jgi:hypothetical protein
LNFQRLDFLLHLRGIVRSSNGIGDNPTNANTLNFR